MRKTILILFLIFGFIQIFPSASVDLTDIEKATYLFQKGQYKKAEGIIESLNFESYSNTEKKFVTDRLKRIAYTFIKKKDFKRADKLFNKILSLNNSSWDVRNGQEIINRLKNNSLYNPGLIVSQFSEISRNFEAKFLITGFLSSSIFLSSVFIFFITAFFLFIKNFKLASNDIFIDHNGDLDKIKIILVAVLLFWPAFILSGWITYPFLMSGFIWIYLGNREKRLLLIQIIIIIVCSFMLSFRNYLYEGSGEETFKTAKNLIYDKLYDKSEYSRFDNDLKVLQAFAYFKNGYLEKSLDILISTSENYRNIFKFNLMGNIYFRSDNFDVSLKYLKSALEVNERDETALYNFAVLLTELKNPNVFASYAKRYTALNNLKDTIGELRDPVINRNYLWNRLINRSEEGISKIKLFGKIILEFFKLPVLYFSIIFFLYLYSVKLFFKNAGKSVYCIKCDKIIPRSGSDKSKYYCDQCYELFQLKDVVFMEAKVAREAELKKKKTTAKIKFYFLSLFLPGFVLLLRKKGILYTILSFFFYFMLFFSILSIYYFNKIYGLYPLFLNITMVIAVILYMAINIYSLKGDHDGV